MQSVQERGEWKEEMGEVLVLIPHLFSFLEGVRKMYDGQFRRGTVK